MGTRTEKTPECYKCKGAGWVWSHELDEADEETLHDTMTCYMCDRCYPYKEEEK